MTHLPISPRQPTSPPPVQSWATERTSWLLLFLSQGHLGFRHVWYTRTRSPTRFFEESVFLMCTNAKCFVTHVSERQLNWNRRKTLEKTNSFLQLFVGWNWNPSHFAKFALFKTVSQGIFFNLFLHHKMHYQFSCSRLKCSRIYLVSTHTVLRFNLSLYSSFLPNNSRVCQVTVVLFICLTHTQFRWQ